MTILDRYIATYVIGGALLVLLVLSSLGGFITFVGQLHNVGTGQFALIDAFKFAVLTVPQQAYDMFPVAVLLGSLLGLGGLAANNELVVVRASGVSMFRIGIAVLIGGLFLATTCGVLGEFLAPPAKRYAESQRTLKLYDRLSLLGREGIWARDGDLFVNVGQIVAQGKIRGIYIFKYDAAGKLVSMSRAAGATFEQGRWHLLDVRRTQLTDDGAEVTRVQKTDWSTLINPDLLKLFVVDPGDLSSRGLLEYIRYLHGNGLDATKYEVAFWAKLVAPISVLVMVILALPFVFGPLRSVGAGQRLFVGMLGGIGFYLLNSTIIHSGEVFHLDPVVTASAPTLVLALVSGFAVARIR